ncbi:MAG: peptidase [Lysobacteraceae bacterium]|nr:MAG: peptidase [Xanthomonadaceae bacterium]
MRSILLAGLLLLAAFSSQAEQLTAADFFKNFTYTQMSLSPNGRYLAALAPANGRRNIAIVDLEDPSKSGFATGLNKTDIAGYTWATNDRLVFTVDADGNEAFGLFAVNRDGKKMRTLIEPGAGRGAGLPSATILDRLQDKPDQILVSYDKRKLGSPDVYIVELNKKGQKIVARNPGDVVGWATDHDGKVRLAVAQDGLDTEIRYRATEDSEWIALEKFSFDDPQLQPLGFDYDNKTLFMSSTRGRDTAAIYRYNPETREFGEMVFGRDDVDHGGLVMSDKQEKLMGVTYNTDRVHVDWFDAEMAETYAGLEQAFAGLQVNIPSQTEDEMKWIVTASSDTDPGSFYLFDREAGELKFLASRAGWLDPKKMSPMKPISYTSRDGMTIHGYLTLPANSDGKNLPLIVNPHGGPFGVRDNWGFNPEHQFFASLGYAVLQVNFRGSGGYGSNFQRAGYKQWGRNMQHDVTDGVMWAVEEGIVDKDRVCIYGGSYGGYATMAGMTFTPDLYQCGVNYVGVTSVPLLFKTLPKRWELARANFAMQVGDPETEMEFLEEISPVNHVDKIQAPIFIVHGSNDPRVDFEHAEMLKDEMESHDKDYEWMVKHNEGHGFRKEENRIELYTRMGEFFAAHIGS